MAKLIALRDLATKTLDNTLLTVRRMRAMDDEEIIERITQVRGIGRWTVEMLLIFHLGRPDVLPVTDLGIRRGVQITYRKSKIPSPRQVLELGERWRPFRSVASWYLWRAVDLRRSNGLRPPHKNQTR